MAESDRRDEQLATKRDVVATKEYVDDRLEQIQANQRRQVERAATAFANVFDIDRRAALQVLAAAGVGSAMGAGGMWAATDVAAADASESDSDGDVGTASNRGDVFADGVDANSIEGSVADNTTITNLKQFLQGESNGIREEHGSFNVGSISGTADDTWSNANTGTESITFSTAFGSAPEVIIATPSSEGVIAAATSITTSGFSAVVRNYKSSSVDPGAGSWIAIGSE